MTTLKGRKTLLNYHFNVLTYQRDAVTISNSLSLMKDEIQSIDIKVNSKLAMILNKNKTKTGKHCDLKQVLQEEQKFASNNLRTQSKEVIHNSVRSKVGNQDSKMNYKSEVRSINKIISQEIDSFTSQKQQMISGKEKSQIKSGNGTIVNKIHQVDDSINQVLPHNHELVQISPIENIQNSHAIPNNQRDLAASQKNDQNNDSVQVDFDKIKDSSYSQLWK